MLYRKYQALCLTVISVIFVGIIKKGSKKNLSMISSKVILHITVNDLKCFPLEVCFDKSLQQQKFSHGLEISATFFEIQPEKWTG